MVPIVTVIVCAAWSMRAGLAPACFPLADGCLSISAACRSVPVIYLFRAVMLPMSLLIFWFWWQHVGFLRGVMAGRRGWLLSVAILSLVGTAFLPLYVLFLGTDGEFYEFLRRLGIYFFFAGTGFAQLISTALQSGSTRGPGWRVQAVFVALMLASGLLNLVMKEILANPDQLENVIEWNFGLIMFLWYALQALTYRHQRVAA